MYRILDLFCGTGAISYGLNLVDPRFSVVAAVDSNQAAADTFKLNHPTADVRCVDIQILEDEFVNEITKTGPIDLVVGGPPCQGFSSLRPSRGTALDDPRNSLYREFQRMVSAFRPKIFLMENVVGLVNANRGELLEDILSGFKDLDYVLDWKILNSANFGVPQKRERFFLLGVRKDISSTPICFPEPTHTFTGKTIGIVDKTRHLENSTNGRDAISAWEAISDLPKIESGGFQSKYGLPPQNEFQEAMRKGANHLTLHQAANHSEKMLEVMKHAGSSRASIPHGLLTSGYSSSYSRIDPAGPAPTITVKFTSPASSKCIHPFSDRAITPREAARLQSFPDRFKFAGSKTDIASQIGNAVPPLLAGAFAPIISEYLETD